MLALLFGCSDPVNKAISEFKKTDLSKQLYDCGGVSAKYEYNIKKYRQLQIAQGEDKISDNEDILVVKILKNFNEKDLTISRIYQFNPQSFVFKKKGYFIDEAENRKWEKIELSNFTYEKFCKDIGPSEIKSEVKKAEFDLNQKILELVNKLAKNSNEKSYSGFKGIISVGALDAYLINYGFSEYSRGMGVDIYEFNGKKVEFYYSPGSSNIMDTVEWE